MMVDKPVSMSDSTAISMPVRNLISIVLAVGVGVWSYFGVVERLNRLETFEQLVQKDLNTGINELKEVPKPIKDPSKLNIRASLLIFY